MGSKFCTDNGVLFTSHLKTSNNVMSENKPHHRKNRIHYWCSLKTAKSQPEGSPFKWETRLCPVSYVDPRNGRCICSHTSTKHYCVIRAYPLQITWKREPRRDKTKKFRKAISFWYQNVPFDLTKKIHTHITDKIKIGIVTCHYWSIYYRVMALV